MLEISGRNCCFGTAKIQIWLIQSEIWWQQGSHGFARAGKAGLFLGPELQKSGASLCKRQPVTTRIINQVLQGCTKGEAIGAGGKKSGSVGRVLNAVGKSQKFRVIVKDGAKHLIDRHTGECRRLAADEKYPGFRAAARTTLITDYIAFPGCGNLAIQFHSESLRIVGQRAGTVTLAQHQTDRAEKTGFAGFEFQVAGIKRGQGCLGGNNFIATYKTGSSGPGKKWMALPLKCI